MKRITKAVLAALSALFFASCVKVYPADDWRIEEYYVMTLVNKSAREVAWFVPKHGDVPCEEAGALPELFGDDERNSLMFWPEVLRQHNPWRRKFASGRLSRR